VLAGVVEVGKRLQCGVDKLAELAILLVPGGDCQLLHVEGGRLHPEKHCQGSDSDTSLLRRVVDQGGVDGQQIGLVLFGHLEQGVDCHLSCGGGRAGRLALDVAQHERDGGLVAKLAQRGENGDLGGTTGSAQLGHQVRDVFRGNLLVVGRAHLAEHLLGVDLTAGARQTGLAHDGGERNVADILDPGLAGHGRVAN